MTCTCETVLDTDASSPMITTTLTDIYNKHIIINKSTNSTFTVSTSQTRNSLDCDQSNYSSRIVYSHIPIEFGQTGISAIRSADTENPILEPNMKWNCGIVDRTTPRGDGRLKFSQMWHRWSVGRSSIYTSSYTVLIYSSRSKNRTSEATNHRSRTPQWPFRPYKTKPWKFRDEICNHLPTRSYCD